MREWSRFAFYPESIVGKQNLTSTRRIVKLLENLGSWMKPRIRGLKHPIFNHVIGGRIDLVRQKERFGRRKNWIPWGIFSSTCGRLNYFQLLKWPPWRQVEMISGEVMVSQSQWHTHVQNVGRCGFGSIRTSTQRTVWRFPPVFMRSPNLANWKHSLPV